MSRSPNETDVYVGARIRLRRSMLGMSQERLGSNLGVTFQQVQKYEKGTNRVGASRLQAIATVLQVPVSYFFEQEDGPVVLDGVGSPLLNDQFTRFVSSSEGLALNRAFIGISDPKVRRSLISLARSLSDTEQDAMPEQSVAAAADGLRTQ